MAIIGAVSSRRILTLWGLARADARLEVVVAIYLLGRPGLTLVATVLAIGLATVFYGVLEVVAVFEVKDLPQRFDQPTGQLGGDEANRPLAPSAHHGVEHVGERPAAQGHLREARRTVSAHHPEVVAEAPLSPNSSTVRTTFSFAPLTGSPHSRGRCGTSTLQCCFRSIDASSRKAHSRV